MRLLVLGLGNILLGDEGVGVRLVERLAERYRLPPGVEVLDGGTSGMDLIHTIADRDALIVCDAVRSESAPGTLMRYTGEELPAFFATRISPHQQGLSDMLATLTLLGQVPPSVTLIGIVPQDLDLGLGLSPCVESVLEEALALLAGEIASFGVQLHPLACETEGKAQEREQSR